MRISDWSSDVCSSDLFDNKVDRKGRVSVPAPFRAALGQQTFHGIVVYPSPVQPALEGCGRDRIEEIAASLDSFNISEERRVGKACVSTCKSRWSPVH